ncbi:MAG: hypothetical protein JXB03_09580 [Spirochaetales bacterium]|nr:hypothetical protein [Spirochaetales bacterium]
MDIYPLHTAAHTRLRTALVSRALLLTVLLAVMLSSCVTAMGQRQGSYMVLVINSGNPEKMQEIIALPFLVDDLLVTSPADAAAYLYDLIDSIGPLPEDALTEAPLSEAVENTTIETKTFINSLYPAERLVYKADHPKGPVYLLIAKGDEGIKLYGITGPDTDAEDV